MPERKLGDGLVLRSVKGEHDMVRYVALTSAVNGEIEASTGDRLLRHHPAMVGDDCFFVEDTNTGEIVSTTCLIPWRCRFEDVTLDVAMLEMVGTRPAYRHRGLIRAQIERFHQVVDDRGFDLCIIQGIPNYYRQFGYAYAVDIWGYDWMPAWHVPTAKDTPSAYTLRGAAIDDIPELARLYDTEAAKLRVCVLRDTDFWQYLMLHAGHRLRVVEDGGGHVCGYFSVADMTDRPGTRVLEAGAEGAEPAMAILRSLCSEQTGEIRINWPHTSTLVRVARGLGSVPGTAYQWLMRIPDPRGLLSKLRPVFERRVAGSVHAGVSAELVLNLFKQAYGLQFVDGALAQVTEVGFVDASMHADGGDLCLPRDAFVRLLMGYRGLDALRDAWPDIVVRRERRALFDALFPKFEAYLWTPY